MGHEVIDNFLLPEQFTEMQKVIMSPDFNWNYSYNIAEGEGIENEDYFIHLFYMGLVEKPKLNKDGLSKSREHIMPYIPKYLKIVKGYRPYDPAI